MTQNSLIDSLSTVSLSVSFKTNEEQEVYAILERFGFEALARSRYVAVELLTQELEEYAEKYIQSKCYLKNKAYLSDLPFVLKALLDREFIKEQNL